VLDYLLTLEEIDPKRTAIVGHSRGGRAAIWAAAEDTRFALAYGNASGCTGAALSRRRLGETIKQISSNFPHWFTEHLAEYGDREDALPVDQHEFLALIAPRALYLGTGGDDLWADPKGEYESLVAAAPVFALHGKESITNPEMPALAEPRYAGNTGFHIRPGGHGLRDEGWGYFLDFADRQFK
jgi:pimeloyl-ACP methyl ester carboxylesterase